MHFSTAVALSLLAGTSAMVHAAPIPRRIPFSGAQALPGYMLTNPSKPYSGPAGPAPDKASAPPAATKPGAPSLPMPMKAAVERPGDKLPVAQAAPSAAAVPSGPGAPVLPMPMKAVVDQSPGKGPAELASATSGTGYAQPALPNAAQNNPAAAPLSNADKTPARPLSPMAARAQSPDDAVAAGVPPDNMAQRLASASKSTPDYSEALVLPAMPKGPAARSAPIPPANAAVLGAPAAAKGPRRGTSGRRHP